ncbi:hypothetical protein MTR67_047889 [Solanum verrucosum]|uniref:Core Histone H2A/H2B/H3 domain-containing protein n=1 Tax=Solanum verrucosum TaxID=315347 RepID=A0AAF0UZB9_SOLVR|nr:hypothetical protein MTR67_047889 [Solanum verrucosum]
MHYCSKKGFRFVLISLWDWSGKTIYDLPNLQKWKLVNSFQLERIFFCRSLEKSVTFFAPEVTRWQAEALIAIQESDIVILQVAEDFLVCLFEDAMLCAIHAKRVTLSKFPLQFFLFLVFLYDIVPSPHLTFLDIPLLIPLLLWGMGWQPCSSNYLSFTNYVILLYISYTY